MSLTVTIDVPSEVEPQVRAAVPDLGAFAREAFAVQLFRDGVYSHYDLGRALGLDRFETDALLKRYRVTEHGLTHADLDADRDTLDRLFGPAR